MTSKGARGHLEEGGKGWRETYFYKGLKQEGRGNS